MYVDESGDPGMVNSPTTHFVLGAVVVHELLWRAHLDKLIAFRRRIRASYGLKLREEIHCAAMLNSPGALIRIPRHKRLMILREFSDELARLVDVDVFCVVVDKRAKSTSYDPFKKAWQTLIQRFENTLVHKNFRGPKRVDECGMIIADHTDERKLRNVIRRMRHHNPVPNQPQHGEGYRNLLVANVVEDPALRDSVHSYFVQAADLVAWLQYQKRVPSSFVRKKGAQDYFGRLLSVCCTKVTKAGSPVVVL